jgi:hypothetical protein
MAGAKLQDLKGLLLPLSRGGGGAVSLHGQRSGSRLATGRGGGSAARCPGAPGDACLARWSTEAANRATAAHWPARLGSVLRSAGWGEARGGGGSRGKVRGRLSRAPFIGHECEVPWRARQGGGAAVAASATGCRMGLAGPGELERVGPSGSAC